MEKSLQMINVVKHLIHCLFNLTGISHFSYFLFEMKTSWRRSKYKPIYTMLDLLCCYEYKFLNLWNACFLIKMRVEYKIGLQTLQIIYKKIDGWYITWHWVTVNGNKWQKMTLSGRSDSNWYSEYGQVTRSGHFG